MKSPTLNSMIRLRSEIVGKIEHHQEEAERARRELGHVDAVLQMLSPGIALGAVKAKRFPVRKLDRKNGATRLMLSVMRAHPQSMAVRDIVALMLKSGKLKDADPTALQRRVENALNRLRLRKGAVAIPQDTGPQHWRLT